MARKRLGDLLVGQGVVTLSQLEQALGAQKGTSRRLGETLVELGLLDEDQLASALADVLQLPRVELSQVTPDWGAVHLVPVQTCETHGLFPFGFGGTEGPKRVLLVAMSDPSDAPVIQELELTTGMKVSPRVASHSGIQAAVRRYHHRGGGEPPRRPPPAIPQTTPVHARRPPGLPTAAGTAPVAPAQAPPASAPAPRAVTMAEDLDFLFGNEPPKGDAADRMETLVRLLIRKGLFTEAEWLAALRTR